MLKRGDSLIAFDAECRHMRAPLESGEINGKVLRCPWHGWEYDLDSGECLTKPGMNLRHYPVEVSEDRVFIVVGAADDSIVAPAE